MKYNLPTNKRIFISSDFHYNHNKDFIYASRGYSNIIEHNRSIIDTINQYVLENDILICLGDPCLNCTEKEFDIFFDSLKCQDILLINGNHNNPGYTIYQRELYNQYSLKNCELYPLMYKKITFLGDYIETYYNNQKLILFHYPITSWNKIRRDAVMLHGHCHGSLKTSLPEAKNGKTLDVGWDVLKRPYLLDDAINICNKKPIVFVDHHTT